MRKKNSLIEQKLSYTHSLFLFTSLHLIRLNSQLWQISFFSFPTFLSFLFFCSFLLCYALLLSTIKQLFFIPLQGLLFYLLLYYMYFFACLLPPIETLDTFTHTSSRAARTTLIMLGCSAPSYCAPSCCAPNAPPVSLLRETR